MADELIDILSDKGIPTGEQCLKSKAHKLGIFHASVHIWLYTKENQVLIQKRAAQKDTFPNLWDISVAGHVASGEKPIESAIREIKEEIGLKVSENNLILIAQYLAKKKPTPEIYDNEFHSIYISELNSPITSLTLQLEEVSDVKLIKIDELINNLKDPTKKLLYVPHGLTYYQLVLEKINAENRNS